MQRLERKLDKPDNDYLSTFEVSFYDRRWQASVPENDYTRQPITYCPYCGDKLSESKYNIDEEE